MDDYVEAVKYLFYGRKLFDKYPDDDTFTIGTLDNPDLQLTVKVQWVEQTVTNLPEISITFGGETVVSAQLNNFLGGGYFSPRSSRRGVGINCRFVSANSLAEDTLIEFWDNVALKPAEKDILQGIHIIAPEVERVNFIGREREHGSIRIPMVKMLNIAEPIPLRSLGEGMLRLFGIVLALVNAQNGLLLIDEVDSGLHYTVYSALWQLVFKIAARLNVQVFATTHSWDCIAGFQQAAQEMADEEGMLIRLERRQGHIVPILFDKERMTIATRQQLEVR
ncbi:MAG: ATP-binding protein [Anaerolineae bacterium]|nr:ATP-binding protein [Anaerolineae bacterium]